MHALQRLQLAQWKANGGQPWQGLGRTAPEPSSRLWQFPPHQSSLKGYRRMEGGGGLGYISGKPKGRLTAISWNKRRQSQQEYTHRGLNNSMFLGINEVQQICQSSLPLLQTPLPLLNLRGSGKRLPKCGGEANCTFGSKKAMSSAAGVSKCFTQRLSTFFSASLTKLIRSGSPRKCSRWVAIPGA